MVLLQHVLLNRIPKRNDQIVDNYYIVAKLHFVTSVIGHACLICLQLSIVDSYSCG